MARISLEPIYILHRRAYGETSLIVEAFSRAHGRVGLMAKGARRRRSRWTAMLEPFRPLLASWSGRGELPTLTGLEIERSVAPFRGRTLFSGFYVNELIMRLVLRDDPHPDVYESYRRVLEQLRENRGPELALRIFEKRMLDAIGYGLITDQEAESGDPVRTSMSYTYVRDRGPLKRREGAVGTAVSGDVLLGLGNECLHGEAQLREAKQLMRYVLSSHLGDKPLAARLLFAEPL